MQDFEQVNQMSCELIEKLQAELDYFKAEYENLKSIIAQEGEPRLETYNYEEEKRRGEYFLP